MARYYCNNVKHNDEKAFEQLFRKYFLVLYEYANFYTRDSGQAEDIVQDIFPLVILHPKFN